MVFGFYYLENKDVVVNIETQTETNQKSKETTSNSTTTIPEQVMTESDTTPKLNLEDLATTNLNFPDNNLDVSEWEVFTASGFGDDIKFKIIYPKNWKIKAYGENQSGENAQMSLYDKRVGEGDDNGIFMEVLPVSVDDIILNTNQPYLDYRKVKINNTYGYVLRTEKVNSLGKGYVIDYALISNSQRDKTYSFRIIGPNMNNPQDPSFYLPILEKILLSFTLVE